MNGEMARHEYHLLARLPFDRRFNAFRLGYITRFIVGSRLFTMRGPASSQPECVSRQQCIVPDAWHLVVANHAPTGSRFRPSRSRFRSRLGCNSEGAQLSFDKPAIPVSVFNHSVSCRYMPRYPASSAAGLLQSWRRGSCRPAPMPMVHLHSWRYTWQHVRSRRAVPVPLGGMNGKGTL